jgi:hypothetical protein
MYSQSKGAETVLLAPLKKLFVREKAPWQKLEETHAMLSVWIAETQADLADCTDELWAMGERDSIAGWKAQIELVNYLLVHPEQCRTQELETLLREKFRRYNELDASLAALPCFDEDEEDLDYSAMPAQERIQRKASHEYHDQQFKLQHQCNLLARFAGVSARRVHDVLHILTAHYTPVEDRPLRKNEKAASWYPAIHAWMSGEDAGSIKDLAIPAEFSGWMTEYTSPFPTLV